MYRLYRVISLEIVYIVVFCIAKIEYRCKKFMVFQKKKSHKDSIKNRYDSRRLQIS